MNCRYDTNKMPRTDALRVCLSCWRRVPSFMSRQIHRQRFPASTTLTCNGQCGQRWSSVVTEAQKRSYCAKTDSETDISNNPFFEKYQKKLQHLKEDNSAQFEARLEGLQDKKRPKPEPVLPEPAQAQAEVTKPSIPGHSGPKSWPPKTLDEYLKLDLVKDLPTEAVRNLWQEFHIQKDCVFSVVPGAEWDEIYTKSQLNPNFLFPLPKGDGYEFYLCQFSGKDVYFTSLGMYQLVKENAPPCLTLAHFAELKEDKGIVLMAGEYDDKVIKKDEALNLVKQMSLYFGSEGGEFYQLLRQFNSNPDNFEYMSLIEKYKERQDYLENHPY